jgi:hypothetical protein
MLSSVRSKLVVSFASCADRPSCFSTDAAACFSTYSHSPCTLRTTLPSCSFCACCALMSRAKPLSSASMVCCCCCCLLMDSRMAASASSRLCWRA